MRSRLWKSLPDRIPTLGVEPQTAEISVWVQLADGQRCPFNDFLGYAIAVKVPQILAPHYGMSETVRFRTETGV